ncbi:RNA polymerase sigma factor [Demequina mangrovi]|uniref:RNA polymerase sigma factor, sigma-70 family n=1 Tax=Demequina mangrovi TaxID=1043493 RepID=A0A1H6XIW4_9MICO|nr:sigma-70 family RNA polymerase sigma factor [Demequina mangrovi]SEJ26647.1 RNA polymerase sigma factor, sigma-70 family [Demequina mangrovi]
MNSWGDTLEAVVRERGGALYAYAYVLTGDVDGAQDLVQEALVRAFRRRGAPQGVDAAHAYVKRAMQTAVIDAHRRAQVRPQRDDRDAVRVSPDPADSAATLDALMDAVTSLPPRERTCLVMRYLDGLNATAIGAELGIAPGAVRRYLYDGLTTLRRTHGDFGLDPDDAVDGGSDHTVVITTRGGAR